MTNRSNIASRRSQCWQLVSKHYLSTGWRHAYRIYEELILRHLTPQGRVLDVGCGSQFPMAEFLVEHGALAHGVDPSAKPRPLPRGATLASGSAEKLLCPDEQFDLVISRCCLEHLREPAAVFHEIRRVLKPAGAFVFLTPNRWDYVSLLAMLVPNELHGAIVRIVEGRKEQDTFPTYYYANTPRAITRLAKAAGLRVTGLQYLNNYPSTFMFSPALCRLAIAYDRFIRRWPSLRSLQGWILGSLVRAPVLPSGAPLQAERSGGTSQCDTPTFAAAPGSMRQNGCGRPLTCARHECSAVQVRGTGWQRRSDACLARTDRLELVAECGSSH